MKWTVHLEGGPRRVNHAAVLVEDKIFSFGGYCSTDEYKDWEPIPVHVLNTVTLRWSVVNYKKDEEVPFQRYGHTAVAYGHKVFMWGGRNNAIACDTLSCFDTKTLVWTKPTVSGVVPFAKDGHSACVIKNRMYIFGGYEFFTDQYSQEVHYLNCDTLCWNYVDTRGAPPSHRDFHISVPVGDRMYIYGGRGDINGPYNSHEETYCNQLYYLDTIEEKWVALNAKGMSPGGVRSHSAWLHEGYIYVFGGFCGYTKRHYNDVFRYSIKENMWEHVTITGVAPTERRRQVCLLYKDKVYLFGGSSPCPVSTLQRENLDENPERLIDNSDLQILEYSPTLKTLSILSVLEHKLDQSSLPEDILMDIRTMTTPNRITRPSNKTG